MRFLAEKVTGGDPRDLLLSPYFGWLVERGRWAYRMIENPAQVPAAIEASLAAEG